MTICSEAPMVGRRKLCSIRRRRFPCRGKELVQPRSRKFMPLGWEKSFLGEQPWLRQGSCANTRSGPSHSHALPLLCCTAEGWGQRPGAQRSCPLGLFLTWDNHPRRAMKWSGGAGELSWVTGDLPSLFLRFLLLPLDCRASTLQGNKHVPVWPAEYCLWISVGQRWANIHYFPSCATSIASLCCCFMPISILTSERHKFITVIYFLHKWCILFAEMLIKSHQDSAEFL